MCISIRATVYSLCLTCTHIRFNFVVSLHSLTLYWIQWLLISDSTVLSQWLYIGFSDYSYQIQLCCLNDFILDSVTTHIRFNCVVSMTLCWIQWLLISDSTVLSHWLYIGFSDYSYQINCVLISVSFYTCLILLNCSDIDFKFWLIENLYPIRL